MPMHMMRKIFICITSLVHTCALNQNIQALSMDTVFSGRPRCGDQSCCGAWLRTARCFCMNADPSQLLDVLWAEQRNRVDFVHTKIIDGEV